MKKIIIILLLCLFVYHSGISAKNVLLDKHKSIDSTKLNREAKNICLLIRLYGYIKYFHPSTQAINVNWTNFLISNIDTISQAETDKDLVNRVFFIFLKVAPTIKLIYKNDTLSRIDRDLPEKKHKNLKVTYWSHSGDGLDKKDLSFTDKLLMANNKSKVIKVKYNLYTPTDTIPDPCSFYTVRLSDSIQCSFHIALLSDNKGTYPHYNKPKYCVPKGSLDINERNYQITTLATAWNIFQHFYADYNEAGLNKTWKQALTDAVKNIIIYGTAKEFNQNLRKLLAKTNDCHSGFGIINFTGLYSWHSNNNSIDLDLAENKVLISQINDTSIKGVHVGDILLAINNTSCDSLMNQVRQYIAGSREDYRNEIAVSTLLSSMDKDSVMLQVIDSNGLYHSLKIKTYCNGKKRNENITGLQKLTQNGKTYYLIHLDKFNIAEFKTNLKSINSSSGLILDARERPNYNAVKIIGYLTKQTIYSGIIEKPVIKFPDHSNIKYIRSVSWKILPAIEHINVPVVVLSSCTSYSYPETFLEIIKNYRLAVIVGENTAGTNGDISFSSINKKYLMTWTSVKFLTHEKNSFHGVGIKPDIMVHRTITSIREKRDEILNKAIESFN